MYDISLIEFDKSDKKDKKYKIIFIINDKIKKYDFGSKNSTTFIEGADIRTRNNYLKRHSVNEDWSKINNGSLSAYILWNTPDIDKNLKIYMKLFKIKDKRNAYQL